MPSLSVLIGVYCIHMLYLDLTHRSFFREIASCLSHGVYIILYHRRSSQYRISASFRSSRVEASLKHMPNLSSWLRKPPAIFKMPFWKKNFVRFDLIIMFTVSYMGPIQIQSYIHVTGFSVDLPPPVIKFHPNVSCNFGTETYWRTHKIRVLCVRFMWCAQSARRGTSNSV